MDNETLKKVLKYTTYVDKFKYHNQIVDFLDKFYDKEIFPKKLINFDLHSDVKIGRKHDDVKVANWVNFTFNRYGIDEYYWVVPKHVLNDEKMTEALFHKKSRTFSGNFTDTPYTDFSIPLKQDFYVDLSQNSIKTFEDLDEEQIQEEINKEPDNYKLITIYTCTEDNLPDFIEDEVIVTVDGDYFSNNGYDTKNNYKYVPENIQQSFDSFIQTLSDKNIYPSYLALCLSNNYTEDVASTENFFDEIIHTKNIPIKLSIDYTHTDLHDDKHDYNETIFVINEGYMEFILKSIDTLKDSDIIELFDMFDGKLENGYYSFVFYSKYVTDENEKNKLLIYKYEKELEKIADYNPILNSIFLKCKNKINSLVEKINNLEESARNKS